MDFTNKTILIISTERWGINLVSKHHYALLLSKKNKVFFLNPPGFSNKKLPAIEHQHPNLGVINYSPVFRGINKFALWFPWLANAILLIDIWRLKKIAGSTFDIVWSFDPYRFQNLKLFKAGLTIFHPVDYFNTSLDMINARTADIIFSVAQPILDRYKDLPTPAFFVNHGVSDYFLSGKVEENTGRNKIQCGFVGNLLSYGIHYPNLIQIIAENPEVEFHLIGPTKPSNLGNSKDENNWIEKIASFTNVIFHGEVSPAKLFDKIHLFDLFLISYHPEKVGKLAANNHKILEFLSTGKVVVSSYISTYDQLAADLFVMVKDSAELPDRFKQAVKNIALLNNSSSQQRRRAFAIDNSYEKQLQRIEALVSKNIR